MASLRADVDSILEMRGLEPESAPIELAENIILVALFIASTTPPEPREHAKRHRYSHTTDGEDARVRNKERTYLEDASRASLIDEETLLMRAREIVVRASSSRPETSERSTTDGA